MLAVVSLAVGNLAALVQRNVKRLLAYSSISHAGFMLIAVAANNALGGRALLYYLIPYGAMSIGAFAVVAARERELRRPVTLDNLGGMGWERPLLGAAMWVFMLGFAGMPLTGGLLGKFYVFSAAYEAGWWWLIVAASSRPRSGSTTTSASSGRSTCARPRSCGRSSRAARRRATRSRRAPSSSRSPSRSARSSSCSR